jgi:SAM-dependent methyltransferase
MNAKAALYQGRKLGYGYPNLEAKAVDVFKEIQTEDTRTAEIMRCVERAADLPSRSVVIVGCGPKPKPLKELRELGYDATGVEPFTGFADAARDYMGDDKAVLNGCAEELPLADRSQAVVISQSVMEHVDSPSKSFSEMYRVLAPGGVAYVQTTNKRRFSLTGNAGEYHIRFFNLLPDTLKEAYVHEQIHFRPELSNYSTRPAVHWFTYADLCRRGREAGFHRFYTKLDLLEPGDPSVSRLRRLLINHVRYKPWLRTLALLQYGDTIFMLKRGAPGTIA